MTGWVLVAGDFTPLGGIGRANLAQARSLAGRGWIRPPPLGRHLLGEPLLGCAGRRGDLEIWPARAAATPAAPLGYS